jgi:hypothetical protein
VLALVVYSDKSSLNNKGSATGYPLMLNFANASLAEYVGMHEQSCIAQLPVISKPPNIDEEVWPGLKAQMYARLFNVVLGELKAMSHSGLEVTDGCGVNRKVYPFLYAWVMDLEETRIISCTRANACPMCPMHITRNIIANQQSSENISERTVLDAEQETESEEESDEDHDMAEANKDDNDAEEDGTEAEGGALPRQRTAVGIISHTRDIGFREVAFSKDIMRRICELEIDGTTTRAVLLALRQRHGLHGGMECVLHGWAGEGSDIGNPYRAVTPDTLHVVDLGLWIHIMKAIPRYITQAWPNILTIARASYSASAVKQLFSQQHIFSLIADALCCINTVSRWEKWSVASPSEYFNDVAKPGGKSAGRSGRNYQAIEHRNVMQVFTFALHGAFGGFISHLEDSGRRKCPPTLLAALAKLQDDLQRMTLGLVEIVMDLSRRNRTAGHTERTLESLKTRIEVFVGFLQEQFGKCQKSAWVLPPRFLLHSIW